MPWSARFDDPIPLTNGRALETLRDAAMYITKLPKAEHDVPEWQAAMEALLLVAELGGPTMFARPAPFASLERPSHGRFIFAASAYICFERSAPTSLRRLAGRWPEHQYNPPMPIRVAGGIPRRCEGVRLHGRRIIPQLGSHFSGMKIPILLMRQSPTPSRCRMLRKALDGGLDQQGVRNRKAVFPARKIDETGREDVVAQIGENGPLRQAGKIISARFLKPIGRQPPSSLSPSSSVPPEMQKGDAELAPPS